MARRNLYRSLLLILVILSIIIILYESSIFERMTIGPISPPSSIIEDYLRERKLWDKVQTVNGRKDITFINTGCSANRTWGYLYRIKLEDRYHYLCVPFKNDKDSKNNKNSKNSNRYKKDNGERKIFPSKKIEPEESVDPYEILFPDRSSLSDGGIPNYLKAYPTWTNIVPRGTDLNTLCSQIYGPNYGEHLHIDIGENNVVGLCSRLFPNGKPFYGTAVTPCMSYRDPKKMDRFCQLNYPGTRLRQVKLPPCPQPGQATGICL